jgi:hypothetical protein
VGGGNECCTVTCTGGAGCGTAAGSCTDSCGSNLLTTGRACAGCGPNLANGTCGGGTTTTCDATTHTLCQTISCAGTTYRCTNAGGTWAWRTATACDDGNACTYNTNCDGASSCTGTTVNCDASDTYCMDYWCDGDATCSQTAIHEGLSCGTSMVCVSGVCTSTCPGTVWSSNGHCYWYVSGGATWDAAEAACVSQSGHLASITSSAENTFVLGLTAADAWIGLRDYATASTALGNCDDCTENCTVTSQRYTFDTCVAYDDQYFTCGGDGWYDLMFNFTPPATQYYVFSSPTSGRFAAISNYINDHSATASCYGGVDYGCGNPLIYSLTGGTTMLLQFDGTSSCGASIMDVRRFVFTDSAAHTYHNWNSGEPNNSSGNEDCAEVYDASGVWNDLACATAMPYVCERL